MAVKNFRIGNDLVVLWAICNRDGSPYNLANKHVRLYVINERGRRKVDPIITTLPDGTINNVIRWDFNGMDQRVTGLYTLSVEILTASDKKSIKKDYCEAFNLVGSSSLEDESLEENISDGGELILSSSLDVIRLSVQGEFGSEIDDLKDSLKDVNDALVGINQESVNIKATINGIQSTVNDIGTELVNKASVKSVTEIGASITEIQNNQYEQSVKLDVLGTEISTKASSESVTKIADVLVITNQTLAEQTTKVNDIGVQITTKAEASQVTEIEEGLKAASDSIAEQSTKVTALESQISTKAETETVTQLGESINIVSENVAEQIIRTDGIEASIENLVTNEVFNAATGEIESSITSVEQRTESIETTIKSQGGEITSIKENVNGLSIGIGNLESDLDSLRNQMDGASRYLDNITNDGILTPIEKEQLFEIYRSIAREYDATRSNAFNYKVWKYSNDGVTEESGLNGGERRYESYVAFKNAYTAIANVFSSSMWGFTKMDESTTLPEGYTTTLLKSYLDTYYEKYGILTESFSAITAAIEAAQKATEETLQGLTDNLRPEEMSTIVGKGVVLSTIIATKDGSGKLTAGINGSLDQNKGEKSIAAWFGGDVVDVELDTDKPNPASSVIRHDGTGYFAKGLFSWDGNTGINLGRGGININYDGSLDFGDDIRIGGTETLGSLLKIVSKLSSMWRLEDGVLKTNYDVLTNGQFAAAAVGAEGGGSVGAAYLSDLYDVSLGSLLSGDILSWNGSEWVNIKQSSLVPDLSAYASKSFVSDALEGYLPKSGGEISGNLLIGAENNTAYNYIRIWRNNKNIELASAGDVAVLSFNGVGFAFNETQALWNGNTLIHSGNYSDYALIKGSYPTSGGNYNYAFESGLYSTNAVEEDLPISEAGNFVVNAQYDSKASAQLYMRTSSDALYYRRKRSNVWYDWKTVAFTSDLENYLPKSGGTISNSSSNHPLIIQGGGDWCGVRFFLGDTALGNIGVWNDNRPVFVDNAWNVNTLIHSGNIGSQSVSYASNAGTLSGVSLSRGSNTPWGTIPMITEGGYMDVGRHFEFHYDNTTGSDFSTILQCTGNYSNMVSLPSASGTLALTTDNVASANVLSTSYSENINYSSYTNDLRLIRNTDDSWSSNGFPTNYVSGLSVMAGYVGWQMVTYGDPNSIPNPYFRSIGGGGDWSSWRKLAFLDDNVASATKLETPRTIWGQSFDGTGNVDGYLHMSGLDVLHLDESNLWLNYGAANDGKSLRLCGNDVAIYYGKSSNFARAMTINASGNVTIGSSDLAGTTRKLYVNGALTATKGKFGNIHINEGSGTYVGDSTIETSNKGMLYINYYHNGGLNLCQGGGYVGVGIENPQYKLDVNGTVRIGGDLNVGNNVIRNGDNTNIIDMTGHLAFGYGLRNSGYVSYWGYQHDFYVGDSHAMRITPSGNVLIGSTTDRGHRLTVGRPDGAVNLTSTTLNNSLLFVGMSENVYSYGTNFWTEGSGNGFIQQGRTDDEQPAFYDLILQPFGGNVGVGRLPEFSLDVEGKMRVFGNTIIGASSYEDGRLRVVGEYGATNVLVATDYNGFTKFCVQNNGNVLIGTTTDSDYKLDVSDSVRLRHHLVGEGYNGGASLYFGLRDSEALSIEGRDANGAWERHFLKIWRNGHVYIGPYTSDNGYMLDVAGTLRVSDTLTAQNGIVTNEITIGGIKLDVVNGALRVNGDIFSTGQFAASVAGEATGSSNIILDYASIVNALGYTPANNNNLAQVAFTGSYSSLSGTPDVYTKADVYNKNEINQKLAGVGGGGGSVGSTFGIDYINGQSFNMPNGVNCITSYSEATVDFSSIEPVDQTLPCIVYIVKCDYHTLHVTSNCRIVSVNSSGDEVSDFSINGMTGMMLVWDPDIWRWVAYLQK